MVHRIALLLVGASILFASPAFGAEKTLVLKNGNVIRGDVKQLGDFVLVRTATTELRLPPSDVEMVANSISEIYATKSRRLPKGASRVEEQRELILWCVQNELIAEAKHELSDLRRKSPTFPNLELLEKRVESHRTGMSKTTLPSKSSLHPDTKLAQDRLNQLSKQSTADYVRTIQPLMMNRCAMAGCHGKATKSEFQLIGSRRSMPVHVTHRNLGATLRRIDGPTRQSLLWMSANSIHGGMKRRIADSELERLYAWITRVTDEIGEHQEVSTVRLASAQLPLDDVDPFDPEKFNVLAEPQTEIAPTEPATK